MKLFQLLQYIYFFFKGAIPDTQWQRAISERGEVVCPTCSIVTRKTVHGLKKHMEICQKVCGCSRMGAPKRKKRLCCQTLMSFFLHVSALISRCYFKSDFILARFVICILSKWVQHKALSAQSWNFLPWFIVLTAVLLDTSFPGAHCTLSDAFTAILLISRQKNNNTGPIISIFPLTVYNMLLLT